MAPSWPRTFPISAAGDHALPPEPEPEPGVAAVPPKTELAAKRARQAPSHRVSGPVAAFTRPPARPHVSQAFNSYVYREYMKRVKAGSPKALRRRSGAAQRGRGRAVLFGLGAGGARQRPFFMQ